jgi:hypothetical protein
VDSASSARDFRSSISTNVSKAVGLLTLTDGAGGLLPGVPLGCFGMWNWITFECKLSIVLLIRPNWREGD